MSLKPFSPVEEMAGAAVVWGEGEAGCRNESCLGSTCLQDIVIQQDDEIRLKIVGTRVDKNDIVSPACFFLWGWSRVPSYPIPSRGAVGLEQLGGKELWGCPSASGVGAWGLQSQAVGGGGGHTRCSHLCPALQFAIGSLMDDYLGESRLWLQACPYPCVPAQTGAPDSWCPRVGLCSSGGCSLSQVGAPGRWCSRVSYIHPSLSMSPSGLVS